ncbi:hypothetical protein FB451DRAFT_1373013 [Mycena latifolia]|nr:hypothetical protein FB451DRAFT_1373013 [Mycena latifolia]
MKRGHSKSHPKPRRRLPAMPESQTQVGDPRLPPELVDLVIQNIDPADELTLRICGLVSHAWLEFSRPIVFSCMAIGPGKKREKALGKLEHTTFKSFVITEPWVETRLPRMLSHFTALTTLRLTQLRIGYAGRLLPAFGALKQLELELMLAHSLPTVMELVCAFPLLVRLKIAIQEDYTSISPGALPARGALGPLVHLHTLDIDYPMLNMCVIEYILSANPPPPVTTLALVLRSDWDRLHECLRASGPALRTLELAFPVEAPRDLRIGRLMTPPFESTLRSLRLRSPHRDILSIAAHLLSLVLRTPYLESLVIDIEPGHEPQEEVFTTTLEIVLEKLPALKSFRIYAPAAWRAYIPASMLTRDASLV